MMLYGTATGGSAGADSLYWVGLGNAKVLLFSLPLISIQRSVLRLPRERLWWTWRFPLQGWHLFRFRTEVD